MRAPSPELSQAITVANRLADAARAATLRYFRAPDLEADSKVADGFDPVTIADRAAEQAMRAILAETCAEDGVLGEEYGRSDGASGRLWVLDPIDGTRAFVTGVPLWGVLIGLRIDDAPVLGVIDQPGLSERYIGWRDPAAATAAAWMCGPDGARSIAPRRRRLADATLLCTTPRMFADGPERAAYERVAAASRLERTGADCYGYALLASGQADLVIEAGLGAYDIQAPVALIEAAGGVVTDWEGAPRPWDGRILAAGCPELHAEALALLNA